MKTKVFENLLSTSRCWIPVIAHAPIKDSTDCSVCSNRSVFVWTDKNDLKTQRVDANLFANTEKKSPFLNIKRIRAWTGPQLQRTLVVNKTATFETRRKRWYRLKLVREKTFDDSESS